MKQKVITSTSTENFKFDLDAAIYHGWLVQQVATNSDGHWVAILYRND